jgi:hypothetical protein
MPHQVKVFVFDTRRGKKEGEELDKLLAFFPPSATAEQQQASAGLAEALTGLTGLFSPEAPLQSLVAAQHRQAFFLCEPDLWFSLVVDAELAPVAEVRDSTLRALLLDTYQLFVLLHGRLRPQLEAEPSAVAVRQRLEPLVADLGARLAAGKQGDLCALSNPLSSRDGLPILPLDRPTFLNVQFCVNSLTLSGGGSTVLHTVLLYDRYLVWSDLRTEDSHVLYRYFLRCFAPVSAGSTPKRGAAKEKAAAETPSCGAPFQACDWRTAADGFWEQGRGGGDQGLRVHIASVPHVLLALSRDLVTVLMLLREDAVPDAALRSQLAGIADLRMARLMKQLATGVGSLNRWHVPGYRYMYVDHNTRGVRASPEAKLTTVAPESMSALSQLRARLEERRPGEEHEVCVRTQHDAWVVMRASRGRQLFVVLERAGDTLLEATEATDRFCESGALLD